MSDERFNKIEQTLALHSKDIHSISRSIDSIDKSLGKLVDVQYQIKHVQESSARAHGRMDAVDVIVSQHEAKFNKLDGAKAVLICLHATFGALITALLIKAFV